jgi:hypothetical protein
MNTISNYAHNVADSIHSFGAKVCAKLPPADLVINNISAFIFSRYTHTVALGAATLVAGRATYQAYNDYVAKNTETIITEQEIPDQLAKPAVTKYSGNNTDLAKAIWMKAALTTGLLALTVIRATI